MMQLARFACCTLALLIFTAPLIHASGSRPRKPPRPPGINADDGVDKAQYALGKKVYRARGVKTTADAAVAKKQKTVLDELQKKLTEKKIKSKTPVDALAGRIDEKQLNALRYYIKTRYDIE
ncbi:MAG: hypothetical protein HRU15_07200 [Planctomycetes bacterium]|nr:hypothetical protein [Planctomycetota bacterium]